MSSDFVVVCSAFGIVIVVLAIIVIIILSVSGSSSVTGKCSSHGDCKSKELCSAGGLCKSGIGVVCQSDGDCFSGQCIKGSCVANSEPPPSQQVSKTGKLSLKPSFQTAPKGTLESLNLNEPQPINLNPLDFSGPENPPDPTGPSGSSIPSHKTLPYTDLPPKRILPTIKQDVDLSIKSPSGPFSYLDDYYLQDEYSSDSMTPGVLGLGRGRAPGAVSSDSEEDYSSEEDGVQPLLYTTDPFQEGSSGSYCPVENAGIIDLLSFNGSIIYLQTDGSIRRNSTKVSVYVKPRTKTKIESIIQYNGSLLGLADGKVYQLEISTFNSPKWFFKLVDGSERSLIPRINYTSPIIRMGTTLDHDYLILQYADRLKIYSTKLYDQKTFPMTVKDFSPMRKRIYGETLSVYVDVDKSKMTAVDSNGGKFNNVVDALINNYGNTVILTTFRSLNGQLTGIRLINNKIYYISSISC